MGKTDDPRLVIGFQKSGATRHDSTFDKGYCEVEDDHLHAQGRTCVNWRAYKEAPVLSQFPAWVWFVLGLYIAGTVSSYWIQTHTVLK